MLCEKKYLLSICVPTFNRPTELRTTLSILTREIESLDPEHQGQIQCIVSDNHSEYDVMGLFKEFESRLPISLEANKNNVGPTLNFENCYKKALGQYVLILSDDDHLVEGALSDIMISLSHQKPDILFLPFAHNEFIPGDAVKMYQFERNLFLSRVGYLPTLISASILRRDLITQVMGKYLDTYMHHYYYFLHSVENGERFGVLNRQILTCPYENNAGGYSWFSVFGEQFFRIIDEFPSRKIDHRVLKKIQRRMLIDRVIPTFINRRLQGYTINKTFNHDSVQDIFATVSKRCKGYAVYWLFLVPGRFLPVSVLKIVKKLYLKQKTAIISRN
jgi:glycosyltransferase involved in cell wall biosynthesis